MTDVHIKAPWLLMMVDLVGVVDIHGVVGLLEESSLTEKWMMRKLSVEKSVVEELLKEKLLANRLTMGTVEDYHRRPESKPQATHLLGPPLALY